MAANWPSSTAAAGVPLELWSNAMLAAVAVKVMLLQPVPCAVHVVAKASALWGMVPPENSPVVRYRRYVAPTVRPETVAV